MYKDRDPQRTFRGTIREDGIERRSPISHSSKNPTTRNSKFDHKRPLRKDPQLSQEETMIGVLTVEFQGILLEIAEHLRPIAAQHQFVSIVEIEVT